MFTGIIKNQAEISGISHEGSNLILHLNSPIARSLSIDQSVSHNGICLTVESLGDDSYSVVAIDETIQKTTISEWATAQKINVETAMKVDQLLDGHIVQGHVDTIIEVLQIEDKEGSKVYTLSLPKDKQNLVIEKGSVALDGISLTSFDVTDEKFSVAIIPYTIQHTNIQYWEVGTHVNIEFDFLSKMIDKRIQSYISQTNPQI